MKYTIKDIAKEAGVSVSTVSRVLNDKKYVDESTKNKVLKVIDKYNFEPSNIARSMITRNTKTIGLVIPDLTNPFFAETSKTIVNVAKELNYSTIICDIDDRPGFSHEDYIEFLKNRNVDGIIFGSVKRQEPSVEDLITEEIPYITYHRKIDNENSNYIVNDDILGVYRAVEYLVDTNHENIVFISGPENLSTGKNRLNGFIKATKELNLEIDKDSIYYGDFLESKAWDITEQIINKSKRPTAILAANDLMALAALDCCIKNNVSVPEDISIMGYDDIKFSSHRRINLSTVSVKPKKMAEKATKYLINELIKNKKNKLIHEVIVPELVIRKTTSEIKK